MSRPRTKNSPFSTDEPVSRSRKWMLLLLCSVVLTIIYCIVHWLGDPAFLGQIEEMTGVFNMGRLYGMIDMGDVGKFLSMLQVGVVGVGLSTALVWKLWRVARFAKQCRQTRSFDMMAAAVNAQRYFWGLLAVVFAIEAIYMVAMCIAMQPRVKVVTDYVKAYEQQETARRQQAGSPQP